jgi:hypothetical protein
VLEEPQLTARLQDTKSSCEQTAGGREDGDRQDGATQADEIGGDAGDQGADGVAAGPREATRRRGGGQLAAAAERLGRASIAASVEY